MSHPLFECHTQYTVDATGHFIGPRTSSLVVSTMFNAPRSAGTPRYLSAADGLGGSYINDNPLAASVYDTVDPWSAAPSPSPPPMTIARPASVFNAVIGSFGEVSRA